MKVKCQNCQKIVNDKQIIRAVWRKQKRVLLLCPKCFSKFYNMEIKDLDTIKGVKELNKLKNFRGINNSDIKSGLTKWTKNLTQRL